VLSFVVGFAMLGALTFLPTYMQFVDGVSATTSGLCTLPMVAGMLSTSMGSGVLVGRTGRYKIFPVAGTAAMAVAFLLMSTMSPSTSALLQSLYLFILGAGIGLCMQVLVLIVQEHVEVRRPRCRHLWGGVLPHDRQFVRRCDFRLAVHQLPA
jgi:cyanate permease